MKYRNAFLFFLISFLIQSTLALNFSIMGVTPNLILCLTVLFSFLYKGNQGICFGIIFGILQDISFSTLIGPSAMIYFFIALFMGEVKHYFYRDSLLNLCFASAMGTGLYYPANWMILAVFKGSYSFLYMVKNLPILFIMHFLFTVAFYIIVVNKSVKYPEDRYYKSKRLYDIN